MDTMCTQNFGQKGRPLGSFEKNSVWIIITPIYAHFIKQSELLLLVNIVSAFNKVARYCCNQLGN